jgi:hypothetical protein
VTASPYSPWLLIIIFLIIKLKMFLDFKVYRSREYCFTDYILLSIVQVDKDKYADENLSYKEKREKDLKDKHAEPERSFRARKPSSIETCKAKYVIIAFN